MEELTVLVPGQLYVLQNPVFLNLAVIQFSWPILQR